MYSRKKALRRVPGRATVGCTIPGGRWTVVIAIVYLLHHGTKKRPSGFKEGLGLQIFFRLRDTKTFGPQQIIIVEIGGGFGVSNHSVHWVNFYFCNMQKIHEKIKMLKWGNIKKF